MLQPSVRERLALTTIMCSSLCTGVLLCDPLHTGVLLTDATGTTVRRTAHAPYGATVFQSGAGVSRYGFTGQEQDQPDLYCYNARYYDPSLGRFLQADTMLDGLNRYTYCGNNPVMARDPSGHWFILDDIWYAVSGAISAGVTKAYTTGDWRC